MISFPVLALAAIAAAVVVLSLAFVGLGLLARRLFGPQQRPLALDDVFLSFWIGYSLTLLLLIVWNLLLPIRLAALLVVLGAGVAGLVAARHQLAGALAFTAWRPRWPELFLLAGGTLLVLNHAAATYASWDGVLYHVQAVKWAKAYPAVPGIANLHGPLAFNNSSFLYDAMVDSGWWEGRGYHVANAVLLCAAVLQALVNGLRWLREDAAGHRLFSFLMLPLALHLSRDAATYSTDLPVALVIGTAIALLYRWLDAAETLTGGRDSYHFFALCLLSVAAVSIKLTAGVLAVSIVLVATAVLLRSPSAGGTRPIRLLIWSGAAMAVFATAIVARGVVVSGYPFFPLAVAGFPVDWRAPVEHANLEAAYIVHTEREFTWRLIGSNWVRLMLVGDVNALLVPGLVSAAALLAWWYSRRQPSPEARPSGKTWWLALPLSAAIVVWFVSAPSHRYSPVLFWSLAALCVVECRRVLGAGARRWCDRLALAAVVSPLVLQPIVSSARQQRNPIRAIARYNGIGGVTPSALPLLDGDVAVRVFRTRSGAELHVPVEAPMRDNQPNACWNAPLPCTPNPAPNLQLRIPGRLEGGFRVDGAWEMQQWPYSWHGYFLPEWRARNGKR
jgi:hypothetical protein